MFEFVGGGELVGGFGVGEGGFEFGLHGGVFGKFKATLGLPLGLRLQQLGGEILDGFFSGGFVVAPFAAAERVRLGGLFAHAFVAREQVGLRDGQIDLFALGIFNRQHLHPFAAEGGFDDAEIFADAVLNMHDGVAGLDVGRLGDALLFLEAFGRAGVGAAVGVVGVKIALGDH